MDLIDEKEGPFSLLEIALGLFHRRKDVLHPGKKRGQGGLPHARRPPQDHRMEFP